MSSINLDAVRIDSTTGMASCIDWVKFLMNATNAEASATYRRIMEGAGESLKPLIGRMRINNCGVSTPVCAASTLIHLGLLVPNSHANAMELQGLSSLVLARALGGDKALARPIIRCCSPPKRKRMGMKTTLTRARVKARTERKRTSRTRARRTKKMRMMKNRAIRRRQR
jgi:hypothetical protein